MPSPLNGRIKRLETDARLDQPNAYMLGPEKDMTTEEWLEAYANRDRDMINELKPLRPGGYVRHYNTHVRRGSLEASIEEARQRPPLGRAKAEIWVCSDQTEAHELVGELAKVNAFS